MKRPEVLGTADLGGGPMIAVFGTAGAACTIVAEGSSALSTS